MKTCLRLSLLFALACCPACDRSSESTSTSGGEEKTEASRSTQSGEEESGGDSASGSSKEAGKTGAAVEEAPEKSKFCDRVQTRDFATLEKPDFDRKLRWDFSGDDPIEYEFTQTAEVNHPRQPDIEAEATLVIQPDGETARVVQKVTKFNGKELPKPRDKELTPRLNTDGSFDAEASPNATEIPVLFPTPPDAIGPGETVSTPTKFPLKLQGQRSWMVGQVDLTLSRLVDLDGDLGAELRADIDISDLSENPQADQWGETFLHGTGILYFNVDRSRYEHGTVAFVLQTDFRESPMVEDGPMKKKDALMIQHALLEYSVKDGS